MSPRLGHSGRLLFEEEAAERFASEIRRAFSVTGPGRFVDEPREVSAAVLFDKFSIRVLGGHSYYFAWFRVELEGRRHECSVELARDRSIYESDLKRAAEHFAMAWGQKSRVPGVVER